MVHCSFCSVCAPAGVNGRLIKWGQPRTATKDFSCEGLLLAHLFYPHPKQNFPNYSLASGFLGQSLSLL